MRLLWDYLDEELTERRMLAVRAHLLRCGECYAHYHFARRFLDSLEAALSARSAPPALRARVLRALRAEGFAPEYDECRSRGSPQIADERTSSGCHVGRARPRIAIRPRRVVAERCALRGGNGGSISAYSASR
jgi:anti-sigma factor RsiW